MNFLYRKADLGPAGNDGQVKVIDTPEIVVVSIGMKGGYGSGVVQQGLEALQLWLEVQVPVRRMPQGGAAKP